MKTARFALKTALGAAALAAAVNANAAPLLQEGFDDVAGLTGAGWAIVNNSTSPGGTWFQGNDGIFPSQAGADNAYVAANFLAGNSGAISLWLLTPELSLSGASTLTFYTRTASPVIFADALEVRLSSAASSTDVGATDASVGDFTTLLLAINPAFKTSGYPEAWTQFTVTLPNLGPGASGRIAFRYLVDDLSVNGNYIGIDTVVVDGTPVPEPLTLSLVGLGLVGLAARRRQA